MASKVTFVVERADRLDRVLAEGVADLSRRQARAVIDAGAVFVDGKRCRVAGRQIDVGARIVAHVGARDEPSAPSPAPTILWRGDDLLAIDKPPGLHVNETETSPRASVVSVLQEPVFAVHRLDRDTSGVLLLATSAAAAAQAGRLFEARAVRKTYWAITQGVPQMDRVDAPIGADRRRPRARAVRDDGKSACTELTVRGADDGLAWVEARPITGRTHQVRIHLAYASSPIAGDLLYGGPAASRLNETIVRWPRFMLHAAALAFTWGGQAVRVVAPRPSDFAPVTGLGLPEVPDDPSVER